MLLLVGVAVKYYVVAVVCGLLFARLLSLVLLVRIVCLRFVVVIVV